MKLNNTTERARDFINRYKDSNCYSITDFYGRYSSHKYIAEKSCIERMLKIDGHGYKILGGNSSFFTCGYMSRDDKMLYIETAYNTYEIAL